MPDRSGLVLKSLRTVTPRGVRPAAVLVSRGAIEEVRPYETAVPAGRAVLDFGTSVLMPGLVDTHVHVNEPGRGAWEGFRTATAAAAAGGVTTVVDMPLNSIPATTSASALARKRASAGPKLRVDCGFWGGVVPGNLAELAPMIRRGALGFKAFLVDSGVPEFPAVGEAELLPAMRVLARHGVPLLAHAELDCGAPAPAGDPRRYSTYLRSRPESWEVSAIRLLIGLCRRTRCRVHVVHLSSAAALPLIARAKAEGLPLTAETCPHYLTFCAEEIPSGRTEFKCSPPIRARGNRERLWSGLQKGTIDMVVSDHSPCLPALKRLAEGDFLRAWGGVASLQWTLPAVWTAARGRGASLSDLARWMCEAPAALAGLSARKGRIAAGLDADLVAWDPEAAFDARPRLLRHRHPLTPFAGRRLRGRVRAVFQRGRPVRGDGPRGAAKGRILVREGT